MENNKKLNYFFKSPNKINYEHKIHNIGNEKKAMTRDAMKVKKKKITKKHHENLVFWHDNRSR